MKKQKQIYVSPETETLVVRFEGGVLTGSVTQVNGSRSNYGYFDLDEDDD